MNVSGDLNRSVRNTKRRLRASLMRMVLRKPLRAITVKELTSDADVNRMQHIISSLSSTSITRTSRPWSRRWRASSSAISHQPLRP